MKTFRARDHLEHIGPSTLYEQLDPTRRYGLIPHEGRWHLHDWATPARAPELIDARWSEVLAMHGHGDRFAIPVAGGVEVFDRRLERICAYEMPVAWGRPTAATFSAGGGTLWVHCKGNDTLCALDVSHRPASPPRRPEVHFVPGSLEVVAQLTAHPDREIVVVESFEPQTCSQCAVVELEGGITTVRHVIDLDEGSFMGFDGSRERGIHNSRSELGSWSIADGSWANDFLAPSLSPGGEEGCFAPHAVAMDGRVSALFENEDDSRVVLLTDEFKPLFCLDFSGDEAIPGGAELLAGGILRVPMGYDGGFYYRLASFE